MKEDKQLFVLYDARYLTDEDRASVLSSSSSLKDIRKDQINWPGSVIVKYKVLEGNKLSDGEITS